MKGVDREPGRTMQHKRRFQRRLNHYSRFYHSHGLDQRRKKNQTTVSGLLEEELQQKEQLKALRKKTGLKNREDEEPKSKHFREEDHEKLGNSN